MATQDDESTTAPDGADQSGDQAPAAPPADPTPATTAPEDTPPAEKKTTAVKKTAAKAKTAAPAEVVAATTTLDSDVTKPSVTEPGDGPADTTDPTEIATSVPVQPDDEAIRAGTVNAVKKSGTTVKPKATGRGKPKERVEVYDQVKPNGDVVTVSHNIDTGATEIIG